MIIWSAINANLSAINQSGSNGIDAVAGQGVGGCKAEAHGDDDRGQE